MQHVLLINESKVPLYRVPVYNYLSDYLMKNQFILTVISEGMQEGNPHKVFFQNKETHLCFKNLKRLLINMKPDVVIFWVGPRAYMLPVLLLSKLLKIKIIHWGHRRPMDSIKFIKCTVYNLEHWIDDAVLLYAADLKKYVWKCFHSKTFVANNTLNVITNNSRRTLKEDIKKKYGIYTSKNIICMGRMQQRKRIDDLIQAFNMLNIDDIGLILAGPDTDGLLKHIDGRNIFKVGPAYGEDGLDLLSVADVYCLPGSIGLSIVDAFYCGLPVVTENVLHGPEITYLKDGINGFMVPEGDIRQLAAKLEMLLTDNALREKFSQAAKNEIMTNGHIDRMCEGFVTALNYVGK